MPRPGWATLHQIKHHALLRMIPTVILSISANPRDVDFCYDNHANSYPVKPVSHPANLKILQDTLNYWLASALRPNGQTAERLNG